MTLCTPDDVLDLMDASFPSAALGVALERGLFWLLDEQPMDDGRVAHALGIPPVRCAYWLQLLSSVGLLDKGPQGYEPSCAARKAIMQSYSRQSWALLAEEARERLPALCDLALRIGASGSVLEAAGLKPGNYLEKMNTRPEWARRFTRMLYELHRPLADALARFLDLRGVGTLMDLGGGSGVVSMALVARYPQLRATVVDNPTVCAEGREIAAENAIADRIAYHPANFLKDPLPSPFDVVIECDVNVYSQALFSRVKQCLAPGGRFIVADAFAPAHGVAPRSRRHWAFEGSLKDPEFAFPTAALVRNLLEETGFRVSAEQALAQPGEHSSRFMSGLTVIEACT